MRGGRTSSLRLPVPRSGNGESSIDIFSCNGGRIAKIRRTMYKLRILTGKVGRPRTMWEAKGVVAYRIEPEGELGEILYGNLRDLAFRSRDEAIAEINALPYLYEQEGLKQLAIGGIKIGSLERIDEQSRKRPWLFRVEAGPYHKYFEWSDALAFSTIEHFMEMVMRTYETKLKASGRIFPHTPAD
jgi:hypothetical protein